VVRGIFPQIFDYRFNESRQVPFLGNLLKEITQYSLCTDLGTATKVKIEPFSFQFSFISIEFQPLSSLVQCLEDLSCDEVKITLSRCPLSVLGRIAHQWE
jgi:hypothetical protein